MPHQAKGYEIDQMLAVAASSLVFILSLLQLASESSWRPPPSRTLMGASMGIGQQKQVFHRVIPVVALVFLLSMVDPFGFLGIIPYDVTLFLSRNGTVLVILLMALFVYFSLQRVYDERDPAQESFRHMIDFALAALVIVSFVACNVITALQTALSTPERVLDGALLLVLGLFTFIVTVLITFAMQKLRSRWLKAVNDPKNAEKYERTDAAFLARRMLYLQIFTGTLGFAIVVGQIYIGVELVQNRNTALTQAARPSPEHYHWTANMFFWAKLCIVIVCMQVTWIDLTVFRSGCRCGDDSASGSDSQSQSHSHRRSTKATGSKATGSISGGSTHLSSMVGENAASEYGAAGIYYGRNGGYSQSDSGYDGSAEDPLLVHMGYFDQENEVVRSHDAP